MFLIVFIPLIMGVILLNGLHDAKFYRETIARKLGNKADAKKYNKQWHMWDVVRTGLMVVAGLYAYFGLSWWILIHVIGFAGIRWFWFDLTWNWFSGNLPFYIGGTANTDKITKKLWLHIAMKVGLILLYVVLLIWNWL